MKKVVLVGAIALLGLASCRKEYTCNCVRSFDSDYSNLDGTVSYTLNSKDLADAKLECEQKANRLEYENKDYGLNIQWYVTEK